MDQRTTFASNADTRSLRRRDVTSSVIIRRSARMTARTSVSNRRGKESALGGDFPVSGDGWIEPVKSGQRRARPKHEARSDWASGESRSVT